MRTVTSSGKKPNSKKNLFSKAHEIHGLFLLGHPDLLTKCRQIFRKIKGRYFSMKKRLFTSIALYGKLFCTYCPDTINLVTCKNVFTNP